MWRQLSEASTPVDYPTNHQSFCNSWEDESACWITSRACWCLFFYSPSRAAPGWGPNPPISSSTLCHLSVQATPRQRLAQAAFWSLLKRLKGRNCRPRWFSFILVRPSVCPSSAKSCFFASVFCSEHLPRTCRDSAGGSTTTLNIQREVEAGVGKHVCLHAIRSCVKTHKHNYHMDIYANTNIYACLTIKKHLLLRYWETLPHTSCRNTVHTYCNWSLTQSPAHPHKLSFNTHIWAVCGLSSFTRLGVSPGTFHTHANA